MSKKKVSASEVIGVRASAFMQAATWGQITGITCKECILSYAKEIETFMLTGVVPDHAEPDVVRVGKPLLN